jgi:hypothetical protein
MYIQIQIQHIHIPSVFVFTSHEDAALLVLLNVAIPNGNSAHELLRGFRVQGSGVGG